MVVFFAANAVSKEVKYTCQGAIITIEMPPELDFERVLNEDKYTNICTFWRNQGTNPDYSGFYYSGGLTISKTGTKNRFKFKSSAYPNDGTWNKLISTNLITENIDALKFVSIQEAKFQSLYIARVSANEEVEKTATITRIEANVHLADVWITVSLALPYQSLTRQQAIATIQSIKLIKSFN